MRIPGRGDKTRSFNTRAEAQEWARITETQLRSGVDTIPDAAAEPTLAQALDWYLEQATPKKKGSLRFRSQVSTHGRIQVRECLCLTYALKRMLPACF